MSRPKIIRRVTKMGRDGKPKVARDRRTGITVERVTALTEHRCMGKGCLTPTIVPGVTYAKVTPPLSRGSWRRFPVIETYHWRCLPDAAVPLRRFFDASWPKVLR